MTEANFTPVSIARLGATLFVAGVLIVSGAIGGSYWENHENAVNQQKQGVVFERKLCATLAKFEPLAGLKAPAGNPATNPSRAYVQKLNRYLHPLAELGSDVGCP